MMRFSRYWSAGFVTAILLSSLTARAVTTSHWIQTNEADFQSGTLHDVVVTNLGDVKLSRAVKTLLDQDPRISSVIALAEGPDGMRTKGQARSGSRKR